MEKTFTVVGTAVNEDGTCKVRWANDLVSRIKTLNKAGCTEIDLRELPEPMTKFQAVSWLSKQENLSEDAQEIISYKLAEKSREHQRKQSQVSLSSKVEKAVRTGKKTDPKVKKFIDEQMKEMA